MDEVHQRIAEQIRELARRRKILLTHLPQRAGVSETHFFMVLRGDRSPTVRWLTQIAAVLECDVADLLKRPR